MRAMRNGVCHWNQSEIASGAVQRCMGSGPRAMLAAWRYESAPEAAGARDLRIDLLRGFCVFEMIVDTSVASRNG